MEDFRSLSIEELGGYLQNKSVSDDAIEALKENKVSGLALLLVSESELKDLLPTIGDRAIVCSLLSDIKVSIILLCPFLPLDIVVMFDKNGIISR